MIMIVPAALPDAVAVVFSQSIALMVVDAVAPFFVLQMLLNRPGVTGHDQVDPVLQLDRDVASLADVRHN